MARKDWFKETMVYLRLTGCGGGVGRMSVVGGKRDKDVFEPDILYGYNMLSIKPGNDEWEFYQTLERIQHNGTN